MTHTDHRTRIKICGLTREADVAHTVAAGADAIGVVLYPPSPRAVSIERMAALASTLPAFVTPVLLFVNATPDQIRQGCDAVPQALLAARMAERQTPSGIGLRELQVLAETLGVDPHPRNVQSIRPALGPGNVALVRVRHGDHVEVFSGHGERSVSAEQVGARLAGQVKQYLDGTGAVGEYLSDQLLLPMALAKFNSSCCCWACAAAIAGAKTMMLPPSPERASAIATSACCSSCSALLPCSGAKAMPILAPTRT